MKNFCAHILLSTYLFSANLTVVPFVDPQKFSGLWYEVARTYNSYQDKCVASTVEYILNEDQEYDVYNRCFDTVIGGDLIEFSGKAEGAKEKVNMSELDMTYFWIFTKRYGVYYLGKDYNYALVADKDFEQLWIMSRKPKLEDEKLQEILTLLDTKIDRKRLIFTPQDEKGTYK